MVVIVDLLCGAAPACVVDETPRKSNKTSTLIVLRASGLKATSSEAQGRATRTAKNCLPTGIEPAAFGLPVHCSTT